MNEKKKALLCGINYFNSNFELSGCINDIQNIKNILINKYNYKSENIYVLTDTTSIKPTKKNIIDFLNKLIQEEDFQTLYFHYSGHGSYIKDYNHDELDGYDECLVPLDYKTQGFISDDQIKNIVKNLSSKQKLIMVLDCCNSGTMVDLKYKVDCLSVKEQHPQEEEKENEYLFPNWTYDFKISENKQFAMNLNILTLSGCRDNQTSSDAWIDNKAQGALTYYFLKILKLNNYQIKLKYLLKDIHCMLKINKYTQKPIIQSSKPINLDQLFFL